MTTALLNIGARSLAASQGTLGTIAHNIANANTAGYSRQETVLSTAGGQFTGAGFFGRGVDLTTVRRHYDQFLTASVQGNAAQAASDTARARALGEIDSLFADGELGVGAAIDNMMSALGDVANKPSDASARQAFIARAGQLAERLTGIGSQLVQAAKNADQAIAGSAAQVNSRLSEIKILNQKIATAASSGQPPNDLLDQRDLAVSQLNELIRVNTVAADDGSLNLFTQNGAPLLVGGQQAVMKAVPDPSDGSKSALKLTIGSSSQILDGASLGGGSLNGLMRFRDEDVPNALNQIGRLALVMADKFNTQQAAGVDATGNPGAALFSVAGPKAIANSGNTSGATLAVAVSDSSALKASDYGVSWDGSAATITRLSDGQATTVAGFPATIDGLTFSAGSAMSPGDSFVVKPFAQAATSFQAKALSPQQLATGYAATASAGAANKGSASITQFSVVSNGANASLPVTIRFNTPASTFDVIGLAGGDITGVPYTPGQQIPPAPANYNGWVIKLDGAAAAGDTFSIQPNASPRADNRNALALMDLGNSRIVDGASLNEAYAALVGDVGVRTQGAEQAASVSKQMQADAVSRQQSVSGVNLDEEAANLLRYQQAYQASAKLIQASQTLFDALLAVAGR
jgi:flagellar hook-associated protein 1 FlgK